MVRVTSVLLLWLALACTHAQEKPEATPKPSVLLVTLDTTRADHLGCYGASFASTPNLDALAATGSRFEQALSPTPLTLPSHATLMSGRVPRRHGARDNAGFRLDESVPVLAERLRAAGYRTAAFVSAAVLDRRVGLARGFDVYDDTVRVGDREAFGYEERAASQTTDVALAHIDDLDAPFFLWVHYFDPHLPYVPPEPYRSRFESRPYDGEIAFVDHEVGRLLEAVRAKGAPLLVAVAGDHGESLGDHGEDDHGVFVYQATQRVPMILAGPGVPRGIVGETVGLVDVAPTILDLVGLAPPEQIDGRSLLPLLEGSTGTPDYEMETYFPHFSYGWSPLRAIVRGTLKYIDAPRPELYDLALDPGEKKNLLDTRKDTAAPLLDALDRLVGEDAPEPARADPDLAEQRQRLESLGYVGGSSGDAGVVVDPKDGIAWLADLQAGRVALRTGDPEDGIAPLRRLLAKNPGNVPAMLTLGMCYLATGERAAAAGIFRRATEASRDNELAHFHLANALEDFEESRKEYERALALNPRHAESYLNYAGLLASKKKFDDTRRLLERARKEGVQDPDIETELGLLWLAGGNPKEAVAALERAIALNPRAATALETLGRITYDEGRFPASATYYERALEAKPSAALARTLGSILLYHLNDVAGARRAFERSLALAAPDDPESATVRELLGEL